MIGYLMGKIPLFRRANFGQANYNFIRAGENKRRRNYQDFSRENMRLHPSTAFIMREAMETTTLVDGTYVEKGQTLMISSYCMPSKFSGCSSQTCRVGRG
ncbi:hypothetical protein PR001_g21718 [Phytophthora rubi]|uniref:Uncharacterized protein n=1 Tax=Phytophthora rubi TaxID=129364 RepID=A0A6A3J5J0_9STRA|nr:hypothetical protein PR001_g21718 [Phytophthora rubi]